MSSFRKIVFRIKQRYQINDVLRTFKQQRFLGFLICQHNALDVDDCCDRPGVHYHGIVEFTIGDGIIENFLTHLSLYCIYINECHCSSPEEYLAFITLPPKRTIAQDINDSSKLLEYMQAAYSLHSNILRRKKEKRLSYLEQDSDITNLVDFILKSGCHNNNNISTRLKKNETLWASLQKKNYRLIIEKALNISKKIILNNSILTLSDRLELSDDYLSPEVSVCFMKDWCSYQKLDPKEFVKSFVRCIDKRSGNRNSIYLQGSRHSGKTYIVQSIIEACIHVGHIITESSAYPFVWEKCVDKRLIVISEPHFSQVYFDQLDKILSGSGTIVYKHNDTVDYLQPTPVIILANEHEWTDNQELHDKIKKRLVCSYTGLKTYPTVFEKKLHPRWLNLLMKEISSKKASTTPQKYSKSVLERLLQSNLDSNNGMKLLNSDKRTNDIDKNAISYSSKSNRDSNLLKEQSRTFQDSENTMGSNDNYRKRPMGDNGNDELARDLEETIKRRKAT